MNYKNTIAILFFVILLFVSNGVCQKFAAPRLNSAKPNPVENYASFAQQQKIAEAQGVHTNNLGSTVAISGTTAVVGASLEDVGANADQGAAYVYVRSGGTWSLQARLVAADGQANDLFGASVAISGETIVVGATKGDGAAANSGAAYTFTRSGSTWTQQAKLTADDAQANDNFGFAVAISGNTVAVGANLDDVGIGAASSDQGSTYIYIRSGTTWSQQAHLNDPNGSFQIYFGCALALNGDNLIVGANGFRGFAYIFTRTGTIWTLQTRFQSNDIAANDNFGSAVGINGDVFVVGAPRADIAANTDQGAVYVFQRLPVTATITQFQKITIADGAANDVFGSSLGFDGTSIIAGALLDDVGANTDQGSAYAFVKNTAMQWTLQKQFIISDGAGGDNFGSSVAIEGNLAIAGAPFRDVDSRADQGLAYGLYRNTDNSWAQPDPLGVADASAYDYFGYSTDIEGNTAVVGSTYEDVNGKTDQGAAYVYTKSGGTWSKQSKLIASDGAIGDAFGHAVAISGDTIVVGAFSVDAAQPDQGAAYVFVRVNNVWTQQAKLTANDGATYDYFGGSVAISGDRIIIGAPTADVNGVRDQGAAYIYTRSGATWTQTQKLTANDGALEDDFGWSVAIDGTTIAVASLLDDIDGNDGQGSAYIFSNNAGTWTQTQKLTISDPQSGTAFGGSISLDGDTLAVGAFFERVNNNSSQGAAYIFTRSSGVWSQQAKLLANDGADGDYFGSSVDLDGNNLVVSAEYDDNGANTNQGSVYVYERSGTVWTQRQKIVGSDSAAFDSFGNQVSIDGTNIVIGAPTADFVSSNLSAFADSTNAATVASVSQGAVYFYNSLSPTAAQASLGGRTINSQNTPIRNVRVTLTAVNSGQTRSVTTNAFGYYQFKNLPTGETYIVTAAGKRFVFSQSSQIVNLTDDQSAIDFIGAAQR